MNKRYKPNALAAIALLAILALDTACTPQGRPSKPPTVCAYFDTSTTNLGSLGPEVRKYARLSPRLPKDARELLFRVDSRLGRLQGDRPRNNELKFLGEVVPELKVRSGADNTYLDRAWASAALEAEQADGDVAVIVGSDWYEEGMTAADHAALKDAARKLAANSRVKVVVVMGANPVNSAVLDAELAPLSRKMRKVDANADLSFVLEAFTL